MLTTTTRQTHIASPNDVLSSLGSLLLPLPLSFTTSPVLATTTTQRTHVVSPNDVQSSLGSLFHHYRYFSPHHQPLLMPITRGRIQRAQTTFDRRWARLFTTTTLFHHTTHFHYHHDASHATDACSEPKRRSIVVGLVLTLPAPIFTTASHLHSFIHATDAYNEPKRCFIVVGLVPTTERFDTALP
jgi:hypothetical protein